MVPENSSFEFLTPVQQELMLAELAQRITDVTSGHIRNLRVETVGNSLLLCGLTNTYYSKQLATKIALECCEQRQLENTIEVV